MAENLGVDAEEVGGGEPQRPRSMHRLYFRCGGQNEPGQPVYSPRPSTAPHQRDQDAVVICQSENADLLCRSAKQREPTVASGRAGRAAEGESPRHHHYANSLGSRAPGSPLHPSFNGLSLCVCSLSLGLFGGGALLKVQSSRVHVALCCDRGMWMSLQGLHRPHHGHFRLLPRLLRRLDNTGLCHQVLATQAAVAKVPINLYLQVAAGQKAGLSQMLCVCMYGMARGG